jgi:hypothetical protein
VFRVLADHEPLNESFLLFSRSLFVAVCLVLNLADLHRLSDKPVEALEAAGLPEPVRQLLLLRQAYVIEKQRLSDLERRIDRLKEGGQVCDVCYMLYGAVAFHCTTCEIPSVLEEGKITVSFCCS